MPVTKLATPENVLAFVSKVKHNFGLSGDPSREKQLIEDVADLVGASRLDCLAEHNARIEQTHAQQVTRMQGTVLPGTISVK